MTFEDDAQHPSALHDDSLHWGSASELQTADTTDIGPLFFQSLRHLNPRAGLVRTDLAWEVEWPFRIAQTLIVRLPFTTVGFAVGWWVDSDADGLEDQLDRIDEHYGIQGSDAIELDTFRVFVEDDISSDDFLELRNAFADIDDEDTRLEAMARRHRGRQG